MARLVTLRDPLTVIGNPADDHNADPIMHAECHDPWLAQVSIAKCYRQNA
jgi:hypothetical protein